MATDCDLEHGTELALNFAKAELLPCIAQDWQTGEILMVGFANEAAVEKTLATGLATFYSRSRNALWTKGETSGNTLNVKELLVDCDQDCILLKVENAGGAACHNGFRSCFYRRLKNGSTSELEFAITEKAFDPAQVYGKAASKA